MVVGRKEASRSRVWRVRDKVVTGANATYTMLLTPHTAPLLGPLLSHTADKDHGGKWYARLVYNMSCSWSII